MSTLPGFELATPAVEETELVRSAKQTVQALRDTGAIEPRHEGIVATYIETARRVIMSKPGSVAQSNLLTTLIKAQEKLPEPPPAPDDETFTTQAERVSEWLAAHTDPAHLADRENAA